LHIYTFSANKVKGKKHKIQKKNTKIRVNAFKYSKFSGYQHFWLVDVDK